MPPSATLDAASGTQDGTLGQLALCGNASDATPGSGAQCLPAAKPIAGVQPPSGYAEVVALIHEMTARSDAKAHPTFTAALR